MATFQKRGNKWRAIVRRGGLEKSKSFSTKTLAKTWAIKVEADIEQSTVSDYKPATGWTLTTLVDTYVREVSPIRPIGRSKAAVLASWKRRYPDLPVAGITNSVLKDFIRKRLKEGAGGVTISVDLSYLATMLRWAKAVERLNVPLEEVLNAREVMKHMQVDTRSEERDRRPTQTELDMLYEAWANNTLLMLPMIDLVQFAIATGMRQGEITRIKWSDVDNEKRMVMIRNRKDPRRRNRDEWVPLLNKTGLDAWAILQRQPKETARIFPYDSRSISARFTRSTQKLEIDDLHFHDMRHEATSRLFEAGLSIEQVALVTGHRDWKQLRRYTNLKPEALHNV